jgi:tetratricopeptide (TPR) repeat protein
MRRQHLFTSLAAIAVLLFGSVMAAAQVAEMRGVVVTKGADGKNVPVPGAIIDIYRTDIKAKYETKSDSKGNFVFAGLPFIGTYVVVASAPSFRPQYFAGVKVSTGQPVNFLLDAGDGSRPTEDEARLAAASGPGARAEDKAKAEELRRKNEEIQRSNEKNVKINEVVARTFKAGNEALKAKRYDEAITLYNEGLAADPEQIALLTNKAFALIQRGVQRYNDAMKLSEEAAQTAARDSAKKDWSEAAEASSKAVTMVKAQPAGDSAEQQKNQVANRLLALLARSEAMRFVASKVDPTKADEASAAMQEYAAAETDPVKKLKAQVDAAQVYFDANNPAKAAEAFQTLLASNPDNLDATLGAGLALFATGDKSKYQEAANYLQRFVDKAPDTHPLKASAKESLDYLKTQEKVQPQRTTGGSRRRG